MNAITSIEGPVEDVGGSLALLIPLSHGGDKFAECTRGIGAVEGDVFKVLIPPWLAEKLGITAGSTVAVNNADGKFNIVRTSK
jgi:hypothetical protein